MEELSFCLLETSRLQEENLVQSLWAHRFLDRMRQILTYVTQRIECL